MSQHDGIIDNQTFPLFRADLNSALSALLTTNSGPTAPPTTYPYMLWCDTTSNLLKLRNAADSAWITIGLVDLSNDRFEIYTNVVRSVSAAGVTIKDSAGTTILTIAASGQLTVTGTIAGLAAATALTSLDDTDHVTVLDTSASSILKKITWANIKAGLKTYFDTLYAVYATTTTNGPVELATGAEGDVGTSTTLVPPVSVVKSMIDTFSAAAPNIQTFNSSGTWTKPADARRVVVEVWGAGGSGGRLVDSNGAAAGGGGGAYAYGAYEAVDFSATEPVVVGTGGASKTVNSNGSVGGQSSFGFTTALGSPLIYANGGGGGNTEGGGSSTGTTAGGTAFGRHPASGGTGGSALHGSSGAAGGGSIYGGAGGGGSAAANSAGIGGSSDYGGAGGAASRTNAVNADVGVVPGGGGGAFCSTSGSGNSGAGANGRVVITTYF